MAKKFQLAFAKEELIKSVIRISFVEEKKKKKKWDDSYFLFY